MVSPLAPQQFQRTPNFGEQLLGAVAQGQGIQQNRQTLQMNDQTMQMRDQAQQQEITELQYQQALRQAEVFNRLAKHAKSLPTPEAREQFKQSINQDVLLSVGLTPEQVEQVRQSPVDDASLDSLIAQTQAVLPQQDQMQVRVQSSQVLDNGTTVQVLTDGSTRVTDPNGRAVEGDKRAQAIREAQQFGVDLQTQRAGGRTRAGLEARGELEPQVQADITSAKEIAKLEAQKKIKQEGQLGKIEDADRLYKALTDADLDLIYGRGEKWYPEFFRSQKGIDMMAQRDQLVGMLNLAARGQLQGQGAVSDTEAKAILESATTLANPNISPQEARTALDAAMRQIYGGAGQQFTSGGSGEGAATPGMTKRTPVSSRYQIEVLP